MMSVRATGKIDGLHHWPDAPEHRAYLSHPHRHMFGLSVTVQVGSERAVEFHDLADDLRRSAESQSVMYHPGSLVRDFGARSCEEIAAQVAIDLRRVGYNVTRVEVDEDGESFGVWEATSHVRD